MVQKKQLHEPASSQFYREVGVTLTVKGALPSVFRWMHKILSPASFCVVTELKVVPDSADPARVVAIIRFSRLHAPVITGVDAPLRQDEGGGPR